MSICPNHPLPVKVYHFLSCLRLPYANNKIPSHTLMYSDLKSVMWESLSFTEATMCPSTFFLQCAILSRSTHIACNKVVGHGQGRSHHIFCPLVAVCAFSLFNETAFTTWHKMQLTTKYWEVLAFHSELGRWSLHRQCSPLRQWVDLAHSVSGFRFESWPWIQAGSEGW